MQLPAGDEADESSAPWQGMKDVMEAASSSESSWEVAVDMSAIFDAAAFPNTAEMGMTDAMAPDAGSHTIIHIKTNLRRNPMNIGLD